MKFKCLPKTVTSRKSLFKFYYLNILLTKEVKDTEKTTFKKITHQDHLFAIVKSTVQNPICMLIISFRLMTIVFKMSRD